MPSGWYKVPPFTIMKVKLIHAQLFWKLFASLHFTFKLIIYLGIIYGRFSAHVAPVTLSEIISYPKWNDFSPLHMRNDGLSNFAVLTTGSEVSYGLIKALGKQVNTVNLLDTVHIRR